MTRVLIRLITRLSVVCLCVTLLMLGLGHVLPQDEVIFAARRSKSDDYEIYRMALPHQLSVPITANNDVDFQPVWSRDGQQIAFVSDRLKLGFTIYTMDSLGKNVQRVINTPRNDNNPVWSPDNRSIAFISTGYETLSELLVIDIDTQFIHRLTYDPRSEERPNWSADGKEIAFVSYMEGKEINKDIYSVNVQTGAIGHLLTTATNEANPVWSPDNRHLLYTSGDFPATLYILDTLTNKSSLLYRGNISSFDMVDWSSDGSTVLVRLYNGEFKIPVTDCLEHPLTCTPELVPIPMGDYFNTHWRPNQP